MLMCRLERAMRVVLIICNLAIMIIVVASFLSRYLFSFDLYGAEEFLLIAAFWLYFIGAAFGSYEKSHIEANFIQSMVGDNVLTHILSYLRDLIELGVLLVFTYWSWLLVDFAIEHWPVTPGWKIPILVPQLAVLVGFFLMSLYASAHLWCRITHFDGKLCSKKREFN